MNGEEEAAMEVTQEPHPSQLGEEQQPSEIVPEAEQVERGKQYEVVGEVKEPEIEPEKVDEGEGGREVCDSSYPVERGGEVIRGAEVPVIKDELVVENVGEGEEEVSSVAVAEEENGLTVAVEDSPDVEKDGVGQDGDVNIGESCGEGEALLAEEQGVVDEPLKVDEGSPADEMAKEGKGEVDARIEKLGEDEEAPRVQESRPIGEEEEKLDGDGKALKDKEQQDESIVGEEIAQVDEKMGGDRETEESDRSRPNGDGLLPVDLQDGDMKGEDKTQALDTEIKGVEKSEIELKDEMSEMEVEEEKEIKVEERQSVAKQDKEIIAEEVEKKEMEAEEEKEMEAEEVENKEMEAEEDKEMEAEEVENKEMEAEEDKEMEAEEVEKKEMEAEEDKEMEAEEVEKKEMEAEEDEEMEAEEEEKKEMEAEEDKEMNGEAEKVTEEEKERKVEVEEKEIQEDEREEARKSGGGKRKRGRNSKAAAKAPPRKTVGEDVCFICLDGGDLVLCDHRGCPKAYHPSCIDRDEAFFHTKGRWDCGWHLCRQCKKKAYYMCYTCQFSWCKGCLTDDVIFFCIRGNKGLCETCMKSVMLIEFNEGNDGTAQAAFDDKSSMDYLFKDYWTEQKEKLSLTSDEIAQAKNRWERSNADNQVMPTEIQTGNVEGAVPDSSLGTAEAINSKRKKSNKRVRASTEEVDYNAGSAGKADASGTRKNNRSFESHSKMADFDSDNSSKDHVGNVGRRKKAKRLSKAHTFEVDTSSHMASTKEGISSQSGTEWASKELLEFVVHMKSGDKSALSQFDVQELLLEYINRNNLRDTRRRSQIVCDAMLKKLFGKPKVGHFEMLKLLESHFLLKEDSQVDDNQGSVVDAEGSQPDADENTDSFVEICKHKGRKTRKKGDGRGLQSNLDDYAAIDMHNIKLIYLRRNLIEALMEDNETFHEKVVGSFVRIRISVSTQKQDIYRLVQVIGTSRAAEPSKVGKRTADCMLEILNLNKSEVIPMEKISNQDFTEEECKRLRQSIKCGLISRLTVGDVLDKAKDLQAVRVTDELETEITRLNHLRDRASEKGRKKELRECVEKLQLLNTPEERQRRLDEIPEVHADPNMDPSHESEEESESEKGQESNRRPRETPVLPWREREHYSSRKGDFASADPWSPTAKQSRKWEPTRSLSGQGFSSRLGDASVAEESLRVRPWSPVGDKASSQLTSFEKLKTTPDSLTGKPDQFSEMRTNLSASVPSETLRPVSASLVQNDVKISDTEKLWHYKDPTGKIQGPFSITQLRKWNSNGYFPASLRIWRTTQSEDDSILLTEALAGRFEKEPSLLGGKPFETPSQQTYGGQTIDMLKVDQNRGAGSTRNTIDQLSPIMQRSQSDTSSKGWITPSVDASKFSSADLINPPTSSQSTSQAGTGRAKVSRWSGSPVPVQLSNSATAASPLPGANGMLPSPTPDSSHVARTSSSPRGFDRLNLTQNSTIEAVSLPRNREDSMYTQKLSAQPTVTSSSPRVHAGTHDTLQLATDTTTASTNNNSHVLSSNAVQPGNGQNPATSAYGWGSSSYMPRPEMTNPNLNSTNVMHAQGQQPAYSHWPNAPANNLPPAPSYGAGHPVTSGTFPAQHPSALPSQAPWTSQVPATQPNMQWVGIPAPENRGMAPTNSNAGWGPMQANPNMGWGAPPGPPQAGQFGSQQGTVAGAAVVQASGPATSLQPGNSTMNWPAAGNMNPGWVASPANPGVSSPWNWQPPHGGSGMVPPGPQIPKGQRPCPYLMQGHCKKGAACDYRHN